MNPEKKRQHSPHTGTQNTVLVEFVAEMLPHDSPEFQERARRAAGRPIPEYVKGHPKPGESAPPAV